METIDFTAVAAVANAVFVLALVWITKRYADETAVIARSTGCAAEAAERSAAAAERQIMFSFAPELIIPAALNIKCLNEKSILKVGGRDVLAPYSITVQICNRGLGHAFAIQPTIEMEGIEFSVTDLRREGYLLRDEEVTITGAARQEAVTPLFGRTDLHGAFRISYRDAGGNLWCKEWVLRTGKDVSHAEVQEPRLIRKQVTSAQPDS